MIRGVSRRLQKAPLPTLLPLVAIAALLLAAAPLPAAEDPFEAIRLPVPGRPVLVWTGTFSRGCPERAEDILAITLEGTPPHEQRRVILFPCKADARLAADDARVFAMENDAVAVDTDPHGHELLVLSPAGLRLVDLADPARERTISFPGGLPLMPRTRGLSRIPMAGDWGPRGGPGALVPTLTGAAVVDLEGETQLSLVLPMIADYETNNPGLPDPSDPFLAAQFTWPLLLAGEDNGEQGTDLFALNRWTLAVYHRGEEGFPQRPTRQIELRPFDEKLEIRPEQSETVYRAIDLNSDGLTDLVLHRTWGSLMSGRSITDIYLNHGDGADPNAPPDARRELKDGFSSIEFLDLDGDGWLEGVETSMDFGLLQAVRMLLTRSGKATLKILTLNHNEPYRLTSAWKQDLRFKIDFAEGRIEGLYPILSTDWNADGRNDILLLDSDGELSVRLGKPAAAGPAFGSTVARQPISVRAGQSAEADLDGDGLMDLVLYDPQVSEGALWLYYNRGALPGTPERPEIRPPAD